MEGLVQGLKTRREMDLRKIDVREEFKTNLEFC